MRSWRTLGRCWLVVATLLLWAVFFHIASGTQGTYDTLRDAWFAASISSGHSFPAVGPGIFQTFHLGPLWFYIVALPSLLFDPLKAVVLTCSLLVALQFPLAWCLARRVAGRTAAAIFVMLLLAPGWWYLSLPVLTHTAGVAASLLLLGLTLWSAMRRVSIGRAAVFGVALMLALTMHPTNVLLCGVALLAFLVEARKHGRSAYVGIALLPSVLAIAPYPISGGLHHDLGTISGYAESLASAGSVRDPSHLLRLLAQPLYAGSVFVFVVWGGLPVWASILLGALPVVLALSAWAASWRSSASVQVRRWGSAVLLCLGMQLLLLWLVRSETPVWMAFSLKPLLAFGLSLFAGAGIDAWRRPVGRGLVLAGIAMMTLLPSLLLLPLMRPDDGEAYWARYAVGSAGAMSITSPIIGREQFTTPPFALRDYWHDPSLFPQCDQRQVLHGELAGISDRTQGYAWIRQCGDSDMVLLGGSEDLVANGRHRFAVSGRVYQLICGKQEPAARLMRELDEAEYEILSQGEGLAFGDPHRFPPRQLRTSPAEDEFEVVVDGTRWSHLMLVNLARHQHGFPEVRSLGDPARSDPAYAFADVRVYGLSGSASSDQLARFRVGSSPEYVDVVAFRCGGESAVN